jgi:medium-chain acyl-[acyl-carrier-protein] hydrolase
MGAHLAFELAREIERLHLPAPRVLIVSGRTAPHLPQNAEPIHQLSDADFIARLQERYQGIPQSLLRNSEALRLFIPAMRADMTLIETCSHQPGNPLDIPLIALGGEADPFAGPAEMQAWHTHTRAAFKSHFWSGGHFYLHEQADLFVPFLGATLRAIG